MTQLSSAETTPGFLVPEGCETCLFKAPELWCAYRMAAHILQEQSVPSGAYTEDEVRRLPEHFQKLGMLAGACANRGDLPPIELRTDLSRVNFHTVESLGLDELKLSEAE